jgi:hypothetical protein
VASEDARGKGQNQEIERGDLCSASALGNWQPLDEEGSSCCADLRMSQRSKKLNHRRSKQQLGETILWASRLHLEFLRATNVKMINRSTAPV